MSTKHIQEIIKFCIFRCRPNYKNNFYLVSGQTLAVSLAILRIGAVGHSDTVLAHGVVTDEAGQLVFPGVLHQRTYK